MACLRPVWNYARDAAFGCGFVSQRLRRYQPSRRIMNEQWRRAAPGPRFASIFDKHGQRHTEFRIALAAARQIQLRRIGNADRKSTRLNSSHVSISYAVFCLKKKTHKEL